MEARDAGPLDELHKEGCDSMITPDFGLFLWLLLAWWGVTGVTYIIAGALRLERDAHYGPFDVFWGIGLLLILLWVIVA